MKLRIFTEPQQGADYETLRAVALAAEELGFDAFFRSDHYLAMGGAGLPGPTDSWVTLGALAVETSRIRLGTLVTAATFRLPGPLAIAVAQVDQMSGGRVELGLGAGWFEREHTAYGIPFPPVGERFDRLEEQLAIITGLWETPEGETFSFDGNALPAHRLARAAEAGAAPAPAGDRGRLGPAPHAAAGRQVRRRVQRAVPLRGGFGGRVRPRPRGLPRRPGATRRSMIYSVAQTVCCGKDEAEFRRRAAAIGWEPADFPREGHRRHARRGGGEARRVRRDRRRTRLPAGARPARSRPPGADRLGRGAAGVARVS